MAILEEIRDEFRELASELQTQRDEIRVRAHLLGMEAAEEWRAVEKKYDQLRARMKKASEAAEASSEDLKTAVELLAREIRTSFQRIKKSF